MSGLLVFDTETTGLVDWKRSLADPAQPRLVQLGAVLLDGQDREVASACLLLRPDGWVSGGEAKGVHAIPNRRCELYGVRARVAVAAFMDLVRAASEVSAFGLDFDESIIDIELHRLGSAPVEWRRAGLRRTCILQWSAQAFNGGESLKLPDAHLAATGSIYEQSHNALDDTRAAARILRALQVRSAQQ